MATAELAVAIPALLLVLAVALAAVQLGISRVRAGDAAHSAARMLARGEPAAAARAAALDTAAPGASVTVSTSTGDVTVQVTTPVPSVLATLGVPAPEPASATARLESVAPAVAGARR